MDDLDIGPILFSDALSSMKIALENSSTDTQVVFRCGFKTFIKALTYEANQEREWTRATTRSVSFSLIISHPIWVQAQEIITALPPGEHTTAAQKCMRTLDRIRQKVPRRFPIPPTILAIPLAPDESVAAGVLPAREDGLSTTSHPSYVAIDFEPKQDDENGSTSVPAAFPHVAGGTGLKEDEDAGGTEGQVTPDEQQPVTIIPSPFALPTPPIDAPMPPQL